MSRLGPWANLGRGILLALLSLAGGLAGADETARKVEIRFDPSEGEIQGEMRLTPSDRDFRLLDGLEVTRVTREDEPITTSSPAPGRYRLASLPDEGAPLTNHWRGRLPELDSEARLGLSPEGGFLPARSGWYPLFENPSPGPLELTLHLPADQRGVGSGSLVEEERNEGGVTVHHAHPHTAEIEIATGPWETRERDAEGVRLRTLFPPALDDTYADAYLEETARFLALFESRVGPYPLESFTIAATPLPVGLAFSGFTLLGERVIPLPFIPHTSLPHELMHAWWGAGVRVEHAGGNWSEARTTYLADYALAEERGEALEPRRRWLIDLAALPRERERPLVSFRGEAESVGRLIGYRHGTLFFHMLRQRLGDDDFDSALRLFAREWMFRVAGWSDLQAAFEAATDQDLETFFDAWLTRPGRPELSLHDVERVTTPTGFRVSGEIAQRGDHAPWPLEVPLVVETEEGSRETSVRLESRRTAFSLDTDHAPTALAVDPQHHLLRRLDGAPPILRSLTLNPESRLLALDERLVGLGRRLLGDEAETLDALPSRDAPVLVVGDTAAVVDWLEAQETLPRAQGSPVTAGHSRFWMLPGTRIGLLSGDDPAELERLFRALPHHGHRSLVVLDSDGNTLEADTWPLEEPGLRVEFTP
jgi:hypothetical protein